MFLSEPIDFLLSFPLAYPHAGLGLGPQPQTSFTLDRIVKSDVKMKVPQ